MNGENLYIAHGRKVRRFLFLNCRCTGSDTLYQGTLTKLTNSPFLGYFVSSCLTHKISTLWKGNIVKYFFYDYQGNQLEKFDAFSVDLISEVELPPFAEDISGCASDFDLPDKFPIGSKVDLVFGDPRIIPGCTLLSDQAEELPDEFSDLKNRAMTFEYNGGKIWADPYWICSKENFDAAAQAS